jgi:hypothetical protein
MNVAASVGACVGPLAIGALTKANGHTGWRNFYVRLPNHLKMLFPVLISFPVDPDGSLGRHRPRTVLWLPTS